MPNIKAGVVPQHLVTHIRAHHRRLYPEFETKRSTTEWVKNRLPTFFPCELLDSFAESILVPPPDTKVFPVLKLPVGYACTHCPIMSKREEEIRGHYNICHAESRRGRGGAVANSRGIMQKRLNSDCCKKVTLDLVGHHLLDSQLDAMYDQFISCPYQRVWFPNLLHPCYVAKPCRSVEYSSM